MAMQSTARYEKNYNNDFFYDPESLTKTPNTMAGKVTNFPIKVAGTMSP